MLTYLVRLADVLEVDVKSAVESKLKVNPLKYPIDIVYGDATKANRRNEVRLVASIRYLGC